MSDPDRGTVEAEIAPPRGRGRGRGQRRLAIGGGIVAAVVALALWGWFRWLPNHRPDLRDGERYGVDVSNHQGEIDWDRVAGDGIGFAYIKSTEGGDFVDQEFARNWQGAGAAGLDRGAYHFFTMCRPGADQARNFLDTVTEAGELPPAIDLELAGNCAARPDRASVVREVDAFLDAVESATDQTVVLYIGDDFEGHYRMRSDLARPVWHRRILLRPDIGDWWIWQVQGYASIDGIDGGADLNVMRGDDPPPVQP